VPTNRIEALSDGVFAIAMTILVLDLQIPSGRTDLLTRIGTQWPKLCSYALSFMMLGVLWIGHHFQFQYVKKADRTLLWINLMFLLVVTFLPFAAALLGREYDSPVAVVIYGSTVIAAGAWLLAHWVHATRDRQLVSPEIEDSVIASIRLRIVFGMLFTACATVAGFIDTRASMVMFLATPAVYLARTHVDVHVSKR
jgi:uncharacterized membrane protein